MVRVVRRALLPGLALLPLVAGILAAQGPAPKKVDYNRDIRPILGKCLKCHGPDAPSRRAGLQLDDRRSATGKLVTGNVAIVPGKPDASALIKRIETTDQDLVMPPIDSGKTLTADEKRLLRQWIAEGAEYKVHWAFVQPVRRPAPRVKNTRWARQPLDAFVLERIEQEGLTPAPEADRETLIRRVTLDLTGLPPTPEEVDAYLADKSPQAYDKVVDRLLASPRYGERMAMDWMDYARYADSNGYQADYERFQWRWRDWVIEAFNGNMPYDEFTVTQLAGDMLPNATTAQKIATGFNRNHRLNTEGGVIPEEWRVENVVDRLETTSAVWLGLTTGCARCHDHKYDPLTQKEFYGMYAFFNNVPESGTGVEQAVNHPPLMLAPDPLTEQRLERFGKRIKELDETLLARTVANMAAAETWKPNVDVPTVDEGLMVRYRLVPEELRGIKIEGKPTFDLGRATGAVATSGDHFLDLGEIADFDRTDAFSYGAWVLPKEAQGAPLSKMDSGDNFRGWDLYLAGSRPMAHLIEQWDAKAIKVMAKATIPMNQWSHLFVTYDGSGKAAGMKLYINGRPAELEVERDTLTGSPKTKVTAKIGRRTGTDAFNGMIDDVAIFRRALGPDEVARLASTDPATPYLRIPARQRNATQKMAIIRLYSLANDPEYRKLDTEKTSLVKDKDDLEAKTPTVMVMDELPTRRRTFVLGRGQYDKPGEEVQPSVPAILPPLPKGAPSNRLGFAKWVVDSANPLTARVTVNRMWERLFGTGIVPTTEDFGTRAEFPSRPELLDWLATELVRLKWDLKAMWKVLVTSATYRQSSAVSGSLLEKDPTNVLLARGPRFRLTGEVIRDQALAAAGLLVERLGGPSVYPYQPEGIWDETNFYGNLRNYKAGMGEALYRRSLYTIWKRTAAPPNMLVFDVPSREICRVRRARTNTPLQALTLLNDPTYIEAARVLALRAMADAKSIEDRVAAMVRRVLGRHATADEVKILAEGCRKRLARYRIDAKAAEALVKVGTSPVPDGVDIGELAALTLTASTLLNLDETITKE